MPAPTALLLLVGTAGAYEIKTNSYGEEFYWADTNIPVQFNTENAPDLNPDEIGAAIGFSSAEFRGVSSAYIGFEIDETEAGPRRVDYQDGVNSIFFPDSWDALELDPSLLAVTYTWTLEDGEIIAFDMVVNGQHHDWATDASSDRNDLYNTLTHELGHAVGLGHSEVDEASMFPTTFPGEVSKRHLDEDDQDALRYLYGDYVEPVEPAPPSFNCSTAGGAGALQGALPAGFAILGALGLMRRRRRSDPLSEREVEHR